ncbi:uncharacterized protein LOC132738685 isoform X2 [Ruditapes philippinarum]|uniref:uncharacterized protein LOC132738685 isoform X2 n=1 Tax=Ruditapes philippinarum TaxID=129788 RepID=UPI00295B180B|nr:uncharacterized protein LOC132738685 isoform X2 [Ruditapes philippinarum]
MMSLGISCRPQLEDSAVPTIFASSLSFGGTGQTDKRRDAYRKREVQRIVQEYEETRKVEENISSTIQPEISSDSSGVANSQGLKGVTAVNVEVSTTQSSQPEVVSQSEHISNDSQGSSSLVNEENTSVSSVCSCRNNVLDVPPKDLMVKPKMKSRSVQVCVPEQKPKTTTRGTQYKLTDLRESYSVTKETQVDPLDFQPMPATPTMQKTSTPVSTPISKCTSPNTTFSSATEKHDSTWEPTSDMDDSEDDTIIDEDWDRSDTLKTPKYMVFEQCLMSLFTICTVCFSNISAHIKQRLGSFISVLQESSCGHIREWHSQPMIGKRPAGNILISSAVLFLL